ncbi:MAG: tRNA pseudouridine(38-40) synthase TruA [Chloroflexi bacterium RBG_13_68_17]|nr:MAG: tRNA pseudouridine(38-40) synthase TruA [Chloroflexi bacterium RBG_13_68_17]
MAYYQSIVAYDGTEFRGFQRQGGSQRTVQAVLEAALGRLGWQGLSILAAGRTDAGVHARGQVIAFHLDWKHDFGLLDVALNAHLPADVAVRETRPAPPEFHPRFSARRRRYRYSLRCAAGRDPLLDRYAWRIWPAPEMTRMAAAAERVLGVHDFAAFGRAPIPGGHTCRRVVRSDWQAAGEALAFEIEADAFLYRMVRRLVSGMVEVGAGRLELEAFERFLERPEPPWMGKMAPARGLCLEAVEY